MSTICAKSIDVNKPDRSASLTSPIGVVALLLHPAAPAVTTAALLLAGYAISVALGEQPLLPPTSLLVIVMFTGALCLLRPNSLLHAPMLPKNGEILLRTVSIFAVSLELAYFGIPMLGSIPYNEFGWPIVHHFAVMHWLLVLFGTRRKTFDLAIALLIAAALFNRQMALFAILAYLVTTPLPAKRVLLFGLVAACMLLALGALRNQALDVDTSQLEDSLGLPVSGSLFFIYLYLTGPLYSGLALSSEFFDSFLSAYWNTVPEWAIFSGHFNLAPELSFAIFYGLSAVVAMYLRRSHSWKWRSLGSLIHVYSFFSFFSGVLLSTPIVASFLLAMAGWSLFPRRRLR